MYSLKKMTQKISKTYTLSFPKAAHSLEAQDQGAVRSSSKKTFSAKLSCQMSDRPEEWVGIEASQGFIFCSLSMLCSLYFE